MKYSITDLSKKFDLPASTIRYYEKIGLLENVEHINSHRFYDDSHVDRLNAIECFKKALLPLDEIRLFFTYEKDMKSNADKILNRNHINIVPYCHQEHRSTFLEPFFVYTQHFMSHFLS